MFNAARLQRKHYVESEAAQNECGGVQNTRTTLRAMTMLELYELPRPGSLETSSSFFQVISVIETESDSLYPFAEDVLKIVSDRLG